MTEKLEYIERERYWTQPDCYDGKNCNQLRPYWWTSAPKEGNYRETEILKWEIHARLLPPTSRVTIEVPCCPKCGDPADALTDPTKLYRAWPKCRCGFSWRKFSFDNFA
jgi:hypothetical protein